MELVFFLGRLVYGGFFIYNAYNHFTQLKMMASYTGFKGVPAPRLAVVVTGLMLLAGGLSLLLGLWPWIGAILVIVFLIPVAFIMHRFWGVSDPNQAVMERVQFTKNLALAGAAAMLWYFTWVYGPGPWSLS